jgi:hypothetical protein
VIGGLLFYTYLNVGIPDTQYWMVKSGTVFVVEMVVAGMLIGWIAGLVWWMTTAGRYPSHRRK